MMSVCLTKFTLLYSVALNFFGLFLPSKDLSNWKQYEVVRKYFGFLTATLISLGYCYLQWYASQNTYKTSRTSNIILQSFTDTLLTIICLISTLGNILWKRGKWYQFLKLLNICRKRLQIDGFWRNNLYLVIEVVFGHLIFAFVVGVAQYKNLSGNFNVEDHLLQFATTFIKDVYYYHIFLTVTVIYNTALSLRNTLIGLKIYVIRSLNLESSIFLSESKSFGAILAPITIIEDHAFGKLLESSKIFNILFECVEIFNNIFGVLILFINVVTILITLVSLNSILISGETDQLTVEVAMNSICSFLMFVIWNSFVTSACGLLKRESEMIINLCCKLQYALPRDSKERQELLNLARQINRKSPRVTAAGFCDVDFSLIFSVFSYVATYIVVLIQFSHIDF